MSFFARWEELPMVSNCANPACGTPLRYLRDGRLFQFEVKAVAVPGAKQDEGIQAKRKLSRQVWHYWLCGHCAAKITLEFDGTQGLKLVPLVPASAHYPSEMSQLAS
jgi:hypothetical protein